MVQLEIAERLAAGPGSKTYGSPSVMAQLACEVELVRRVDRAVFNPRPRVDSAIVRLRRRGPDAGDDLRRLVRGGFAHRRKALPGSLALAEPELGRDRVRAALARRRAARGRARRVALARGLQVAWRRSWGRDDSARARPS